MYNILICDDDKDIVSALKIYLESEGYRTFEAYNGKEALAILDREDVHLVLLDVMLPGADGFELMEYIRPLEIPVIFLTAKNAVTDRVKGLKMGAEDYIVKPFEIIELLARVEVVLRRYNKLNHIIEIAGLTIDTRSMVVRRGSEEIQLTNKEYELLLLFAQNPGVALYRETIYERVWGGEYLCGSRTVDLHVQRMRKKVGWDNILVAIHKVGYRLEA